jgi:predicted dehydrogenase
MTKKAITYGVIGVGALGRHHARWARQIEAFDLAGVYDIKSDRATEVAAEIGCRSYNSLPSLLAECEAVSIAATTSNHCEVALQVIAAGKHLLIEKPIAATLDEADHIIEAADKAGVCLMVGHIERFNPAVAALKNHEISPRFIEGHRLAAFNPRGADVAVVLDLMIHDIDLALHLIESEVTDISASAVAVVSDSVDIANARLTFANGAVANLTASRISLKPMRKLRIFQPSGYYSLDLAEKQADLYRMLDGDPMDGELSLPLGQSGKKLGYLKEGETSQDMLEMELKAFAEAIKGNIPVPISGADGRAALQVALAVIDESRTSAQAFGDDER